MLSSLSKTDTERPSIIRWFYLQNIRLKKMVEQFESFPMDRILSWVNEFELCSNVTLDQLRQPDAQTVTQIYLCLLQGMSLEYQKK